MTFRPKVHIEDAQKGCLIPVRTGWQSFDVGVIVKLDR